MLRLRKRNTWDAGVRQAINRRIREIRGIGRTRGGGAGGGNETKNRRSTEKLGVLSMCPMPMSAVRAAFIPEGAEVKS